MSTSGVSGVTLHLSNYSTQLQEKQQENRTAVPAVDSTLMSTLQTDYVNISSEAYDKSQSMMAENFVGGSSTDSTYINAQLSMLSTQRSMKNSMNKSLASTIEEAAFWYGDPQMRNAKMMKDATESNQQVFSDIKDNIEEKAAAATAPKDENGNPTGEGTTTSSTASASTDTAQASDVTVESAVAAQAAAPLSASAAGSVPPGAESPVTQAVSSSSAEG